MGDAIAKSVAGSTASRIEYEHRMHRVIEHIDKHLDQSLDLAQLAEVAHFSPFHFHRLFSAWMGETLGDYLRRRRVEIAAMRLASQPRLTILAAALSVGFGSAEAFTRAFNGRFGCSPTAWRKLQARSHFTNSKLGQVDRKNDQASTARVADHEISSQPRVETIMSVRLVDRKPASVVCLRHLGPYGESLSRFWQDVYYPWAVTHNLLGQPRYGISHDDPGITAPDQCRYDACAEVAPDFMPTGKAFKTTGPGGQYAVLDFKGTAATIGDPWNSLLRDWLPSSGLQLDARPCFEYYPKDASYDPKTGEFSCEICIPVVPL